MRELMARVARELVEDATSTLETFIDRDQFEVRVMGATSRKMVLTLTFTEGAFREYREALRAAQCPAEDVSPTPTHGGATYYE